MDKYLEKSEYIDWHNENILQLASELAKNKTDKLSIVNSCFEWVRDNIKHSWDYKLNPVTCKASDVLKHGTGYCYAKSHLLAALLRANKIPAGLCYQRLSVNDDGAPYCLHGLNAVFLKQYGWYRIDARGNKEGIDAQFTPPYEKLAFSINDENERDLSGIWPRPLDVVVDVLNSHLTVESVIQNLPDIELIK